MLELRGISKNYNDDQILDNINITFPGRGLYFICGPSGCGKTSLLNIIGKLDLEYEGRVIFQGDDINDIKDYYLNYLAFVFQELNLFTWLNSTDNYLLPSYIRSVSKRVINKVLDKFNLTKLNNKILNLSGGQRQKIAIARAIIGQKHILLCDEPTGSLDDVSSKEVYNLLKEMSDELLVIVVSHDIDNAKKYGDGIIDLSNKKIDFKFKNKKIHKINSFKKNNFKFLKLSLKYFMSNFKVNKQAIFGLYITLFSLMLVFTFTKSLKNQIKKQLSVVIPETTISIKNKEKPVYSYQDLLSIKNPNITWTYGELVNYQLIGITNNKIFEPYYIGDTSKSLDRQDLLFGKLPNNLTEVVISQRVANYLYPKMEYNNIINQKINLNYQFNDIKKSKEVKIVGIKKGNDLLKSIFLIKDGNMKIVKELFNIKEDSLLINIGLIEVKDKNIITQLQKQYPSYKFDLNNTQINKRIDLIINKIELLLSVFSLMSILGSVFLITQVLYFNIVGKTRDLAILKSLGFLNKHLKLLVVNEAILLFSIAYIFSFFGMITVELSTNNFVFKYFKEGIYSNFIQLDYRTLVYILVCGLMIGLIISLIPSKKIKDISLIKTIYL